MISIIQQAKKFKSEHNTRLNLFKKRKNLANKSKEKFQRKFDDLKILLTNEKTLVKSLKQEINDSKLEL